MLAAGDTLYVRQGVYNETVSISSSGTATQPIRIMAYPGEKPVVDGNNYQLPTTEWGVLFRVSGSYVEVSGLEVRYSNWMGVLLSGQHDKMSSMDVHHNKENGILITGDYGLVEDSKVWYNCASNENGNTTRDGWASGLTAARHPNYAVLRRNVVFNNWGEGLSTYEANGTTLEDNVVYDNHTNIYISDATNVLCRRNLVYATGTVMNAGSRVGIMMGDEKYNPPSSDITVINNLVVGANRNYYWWQGVDGGGMKNVLVAHNTFVNSRSEDGVQINSGPHQNVRFENNIIQQDGSLPIALVPSSSGLTFSNNLWSKSPPSTAASASDIIAAPRLAQTGSVQAGVLTAEWFRLLADSPAIDRAKLSAEVQDDYFGVPRGAKPDIGGAEYALSTATPGPLTATATPVPPTPTRTNTPVPPTPTRTNTPIPPTATRTNTPVPPTATRTNTPVPPTATRTNTPRHPRRRQPTPSAAHGHQDEHTRATHGDAHQRAHQHPSAAHGHQNEHTCATHGDAHQHAHQHAGAAHGHQNEHTGATHGDAHQHADPRRTPTRTTTPDTTSMPTNTSVPPTETPTSTRTNTPVPPTATETPVPPTPRKPRVRPRHRRRRLRLHRTLSANRHGYAGAQPHAHRRDRHLAYTARGGSRLLSIERHVHQQLVPLRQL